MPALDESISTSTSSSNDNNNSKDHTTAPSTAMDIDQTTINNENNDPNTSPSTTSTIQSIASISKPLSTAATTSQDIYSPEMMKLYYTHLFPSSLLLNWLSYGGSENIYNREFSFTLPGDIYIRYCSFMSKEAFKDQLIRKLPEKIDIGAVYNITPEKHQSTIEFIPLSKELVF